MRRVLIVVACLVLIAAPLAAAAEAPKGTIVHSVYFWLKKEATDEDVKTLIADSEYVVSQKRPDLFLRIIGESICFPRAIPPCQNPDRDYPSLRHEAHFRVLPGSY